MGRKPNPLIGANFVRGPKLKDNSNRYQHTCKACGQHFPKGRIEVLLGHILKKCPSISLDLRHDLLSQAYDISLPDGSFVQQSGGVQSQNPNSAVDTSVAVSGTGYHALNVLAEASQQFENNVCPGSPVNTRADAGVGPSVTLDPSLDVDNFGSFINITDDNIIPKVSPSFDSNGPSTLASFTSATNHSGLSSSHVTASSTTGPTLSSHGPDLEGIAASASEIMHLAPDFELSHGTIADELLLDKPVMGDPSEGGSSARFMPTEPVSQSFDSPVQALESKGIQRTPDSSSSLRRLAMHLSPKSAHFISESGTESKSMRPKVRGKFTQERRKEVQSIRKLGACMRCRMLKKTCSGGTPCQACAAIDSPRVWKRRCIRTKLVNEFTLFSVGLESTLSYREIFSARERTKVETFDGYIQAFHFDCDSPGINLKGLQLTAKAMNSDAHEIPPISQSASENDCGLVVIDFGEDDTALNMQVDQYLRDIRSSLLTAEPSPILTSTLQTAMALLDDQSDSLLDRVVNLWSTVLALVDPDFAFKLVARPGAVPHPGACGEEAAGPGVALTQSEWPESFRLINSQLRSVVEKRAAKLGKGVLVDMERRLMQKPHENRFHTFIAAVLLMNCAERMSFHFGKWTLLDEALWPLEKTPGMYGQEADAFSNILESLLELRGIPPRAIVDPVSNILVPEGTMDKFVISWFEKISITAETLTNASDRPLVKNDCRCLDMKLFARFLRPEKRQVTSKEY